MGTCFVCGLEIQKGEPSDGTEAHGHDTDCIAALKARVILTPEEAKLALQAFVSGMRADCPIHNSICAKLQAMMEKE